MMGNSSVFMRNAEPPACPPKPCTATFPFTHGWKQKVGANLWGANPSNYLPPKNLCSRGEARAARACALLRASQAVAALSGGTAG